MRRWLLYSYLFAFSASILVKYILLCMILQPEIEWCVFVYVAISAGSEFKLLSPCTCLGDVITYQCTIHGSGTTIWKGSAFIDNCVTENIQLRHSQFNASSGSRITGECGRAWMVYEVASVNNTFTSRLNVTITKGIVGETIQCVYDDGGTEAIIGSDNLTLSSGQKYFRCHINSLFKYVCDHA